MRVQCGLVDEGLTNGKLDCTGQQVAKGKGEGYYFSCVFLPHSTALLLLLLLPFAFSDLLVCVSAFMHASIHCQDISCSSLAIIVKSHRCTSHTFQDSPYVCQKNDVRVNTSAIPASYYGCQEDGYCECTASWHALTYASLGCQLVSCPSLLAINTNLDSMLTLPTSLFAGPNKQVRHMMIMHSSSWCCFEFRHIKL